MRGGVLRREAERAMRARPIALRKNIRARQQIAQHAAALLALEFDKARQLAAAGVDGEPGNRRQIGPGDQHHVGAMRRRACGPRRDPRSPATDRARAGPRADDRPSGHGFGAASPIFSIAISGNRGERLGMRQRRPFLVRAHHRDHAAAGIGRGLERLAVPLHQRGLNLVALRLAVQHLADGVAVMRKLVCSRTKRPSRVL